MKTSKQTAPLSFRLILVLLAVGSVVTGCFKSTAEKSSESDSNGYMCVAEHKFHTPRKVFADKCPVCSTVDLNLVFGYVCEVDPKFKPENFQPGCGTVTISPNNISPVVCTKCAKHLTAFKLPSGKELEAWGATKATREQVLLNP